MNSAPRKGPSGVGSSNAHTPLVITRVTPAVLGGRHPAKAVVGDTVTIEATVFRHGHERVRAALLWQPPSGHAGLHERPMTLVNPGLDLWRAELPLDLLGKYEYTIAAWTDHYASWVAELSKRIDAAQPDVATEIDVGLALVERVFAGAHGIAKRDVHALLQRLHDAASDPGNLLRIASSERTLSLMANAASRPDEVRYEPALAIWADPPRARCSAWYELFIRSETLDVARSGTFQQAASRLPDIRRMGFDVVYLAPIHPIGLTNRKGRNNSLRAEPGDPGSPWAIGGKAGGHTAVEPALGTLADFDDFVASARALDMDVALDFAVQCSPDHPWVTEHPEWFHHRPDGTIRYAENPPKKYQDIYPLNFECDDWMGLWEALRDIIRFWMARGVRIFRVDNPHTKPLPFWAWLIETVRAENPDVFFLAEAFTRPPMMEALAQIGFSQSYTYFTWRNTKAELTAYLTELTQPEAALTFRPNFFANTPDILPPILQSGSRAAFKLRLVLAATLSPAYGIYSGFELCEHAAIDGREEYLDSEKYEIKVRDWSAPGNLAGFIARVNQARADNPALHQFTNLHFLDVDNDQLIAYAKWDVSRVNWVIIVVNLDPTAAHEATLRIPLDRLGLADGESFIVSDALNGAQYVWGNRNYVKLDPLNGEPAHILRVTRH